ncbi:MAG: amino acid permease [Acidobacteriaceae bacterium]
MSSATKLARKLGLFDATMLVMGGIVGAGIFINPYVVAQQVHTAGLIMSAWVVGGAVSLIGAFVYAELAQRMPATGGQYAYIRDAYGALPAFLYGWALLLVVQTGGMAAVAVTFSRYFVELTGWAAKDWIPAVVALTLLTLVNAMGVRSGGTVQSALMVFKIASVSALIGVGAFAVRGHFGTTASSVGEHGWVSSFGAALIPVLFSYGGYQTSCFVAGEMRDPRGDLPRALVMGVIGVALLYCGVNYVCLRAFGPEQLAVTKAPASALMRTVLGGTGVKLIAAGIAVSALGFLSQGILTAPRVYFAMAEDGVFFRPVAWVTERTRVPLIAITVQSVWTVIILLSGSYEQILNYVESVDAIFFAVTASVLLVRWGREVSAALKAGTVLYIAVNAFMVVNTVWRYPGNTLVGMAILVSGVPVYWLWKRVGARRID